MRPVKNQKRAGSAPKGGRLILRERRDRQRPALCFYHGAGPLQNSSPLAVPPRMKAFWVKWRSGTAGPPRRLPPLPQNGSPLQARQTGPFPISRRYFGMRASNSRPPETVTDRKAASSVCVSWQTT